ncbi:MAG: flagellar biosynthetic protein FliR [Spirochaetaceae bacterium]|jgi:flagellar biosynthetic protein FliR|nr:flagellar biosynthetic protein FliR [Spirochaetaceae bacterium]
MIDEILRYGPAFLLIAVRALAIIETAPLLSSDAIPQMVKLALAGFAAYAAFPSSLARTWDLSPYGLSFIFLVLAEGIIGVIIGFFLTLIFSAFTTAGQFFSLQMGFGASETFDPLSQIENPLLGQYLNLVAMLVFLSIGGFQELFLGGFWRSVQSLNIVDLVEGRDAVMTLLLKGLSGLFLDAMTLSMPILGTLFLTSLATGLISKAAPQINILSEGFPVSITVAFILIFATLPFMVDLFSRVVGVGFETIEGMYIQLGRSLGETE